MIGAAKLPASPKDRQLQSVAEFDARLRKERSLANRLHRLRAQLSWHRDADRYTVLFLPYANARAVPYRGAPRMATLDEIELWLKSKADNRRII